MARLTASSREGVPVLVQLVESSVGATTFDSVVTPSASTGAAPFEDTTALHRSQAWCASWTIRARDTVPAMPIDHVGLGVPDVDAAKAYYDEFMPLVGFVREW
jgi:hypothetical protein